MAEKCISALLLLTVFFQAHGQSEVSFPRQELRAMQSRLDSGVQLRKSMFLDLETRVRDDINGWYFPSPELQMVLEETLMRIKQVLDQAQNFVDGAEKMLSVLETVQQGMKPEWIQRVRHLQSLADQSLINAEDNFNVVLKFSDTVLEDQFYYNQAKSDQLVETKNEMDEALNRLLEQTLQIGRQATKVLTQAVKDWTIILRRYLKDNAGPALEKLNQTVEKTLFDLSQLKPEDIEIAMTDSHHCVEDVKALFVNSGVPTNVIRHAINPVQLGVFAVLTRGKNVSYQRKHITRR